MTRSREEVTVDVVLDWRMLIAIMVAIGLSTVLMSVAIGQAPSTVNGSAVQAEVRDHPDTTGPALQPRSQAAQQFVTLRAFYLTDENYGADEALAACASGYHMASLWEVLDVSALAYVYDHPDAHTKDDSGRGPPSHWYGWIRTGYSSGSSDTAGIGNCRSWTSTVSGHSGTIVRLTYDWTAAGTVVGPWEADAFTCSSVAPVWCIED